MLQLKKNCETIFMMTRNTFCKLASQITKLNVLSCYMLEINSTKTVITLKSILFEVVLDKVIAGYL